MSDVQNWTVQFAKPDTPILARQTDTLRRNSDFEGDLRDLEEL
jgi:hypothetical protein